MRIKESQEIYLGKNVDASMVERLSVLKNENFSDRLWSRDPSLWPADESGKKIISNSLGWLDSISAMQQKVEELSAFRELLLSEGFTHAVCMGMGGSSMAPLVMHQCLKPVVNGLKLTVLDTTDPKTIIDLENNLPLAETLFIVASKSGTTAEPLSLMEYFYNSVDKVVKNTPGNNFIAITDPGSSLEREAGYRGFRAVFAGIPDIGGRYSALSPFGIVPAALAGLDVNEILNRAGEMAAACRAPEEESPGIFLGTAIGELAKQGRDKLTLATTEAVAPFGLWLEQLIAESTGKQGSGILPVTGEPLGHPEVYGEDRIFVHIGEENENRRKDDEALEALEEAGHPVIRITMRNLLDMGAEFMRWEIATATAGAVLEINPFDQPNVQESKTNTNRLLDQVNNQGLQEEVRPAIDGPISVYGAAGSLGKPGINVAEIIASLLQDRGPDDYIAFMAYITETGEIDNALKGIRINLRDALHTATTIGYGPRFLHSTGQYHKGGPNTGIFIQLTAGDSVDAQVPGSSFSFGQIKRAQALGDLEALSGHGRRALRIDLGQDALAGLKHLEKITDQTLAEMH